MKNDNYRPKYTQPPKLDEAGLVAYLKTQPDVAAAYLFGSLATGKATEHSDIDIAILLTQAPEDPLQALYRRADLMSAVARFADRETDVAILNRADPILANQILSFGRLLYEGNRAARVRFEVAAGMEYADYKPTFDYFADVMLRQIKEGRFAKRRRSRRATESAA